MCVGNDNPAGWLFLAADGSDSEDEEEDDGDSSFDEEESSSDEGEDDSDEDFEEEESDESVDAEEELEEKGMVSTPILMAHCTHHTHFCAH